MSEIKKFEEMTREEFEEYKKQTLQKARTMRALDEQILAEREQENEKIANMSEEERQEYYEKMYEDAISSDLFAETEIKELKTKKGEDK